MVRRPTPTPMCVGVGSCALPWRLLAYGSSTKQHRLWLEQTHTILPRPLVGCVALGAGTSSNRATPHLVKTLTRDGRWEWSGQPHNSSDQFSSRPLHVQPRQVLGVDAGAIQDLGFVYLAGRVTASCTKEASQRSDDVPCRKVDNAGASSELGTPRALPEVQVCGHNQHARAEELHAQCSHRRPRLLSVHSSEWKK